MKTMDTGSGAMVERKKRIELGVGYPLVSRAGDLYVKDDAVVLMKTTDFNNGDCVRLKHAVGIGKKYRLVLEEL